MDIAPAELAVVRGRGPFGVDALALGGAVCARARYQDVLPAVFEGDEPSPRMTRTATNA